MYDLGGGGTAGVIYVCSVDGDRLVAHLDRDALARHRGSFTHSGLLHRGVGKLGVDGDKLYCYIRGGAVYRNARNGDRLTVHGDRDGIAGADTVVDVDVLSGGADICL